jgi:hypothetical protein
MPVSSGPLLQPQPGRWVARERQLILTLRIIPLLRPLVPAVVSRKRLARRRPHRRCSGGEPTLESIRHLQPSRSGKRNMRVFVTSRQNCCPHRQCCQASRAGASLWVLAPRPLHRPRPGPALEPAFRPWVRLVVLVRRIRPACRLRPGRGSYRLEVLEELVGGLDS